MKKISFVIGMLFITAVLFSGCTISPLNHHEIESYDDNFVYRTMLTEPGKIVRIQAYNKKTKKWVALEEFRSMTHSNFEPGELGPNSPLLYEAYGDLTLDNKCFWTKDCREPVYGERYTAKIRSKTRLNSGLQVDVISLDTDSWDCITEKTSNGEDFNNSVWKCRSKDHPVISIHTKSN